MKQSFFFVHCLLLYIAYVGGGRENDFYSHTVKDVTGKDINLEEYRGTVSLVVNVASQCGYTDSHYNALVELHDELSPTGKFQVLAFPCNQFGAQEPHGNKEILKFVQMQYGANFPVFSKIDVVGDNANYAFASLISQSGQAPTWNFWKYLVNAEGKVIGAWGPQQSVESITNIHSTVMSNLKSELVEYKDEAGHVFEAYVARDSSKHGQQPVVLIFPTYAGRTEAEDKKANILADMGYVGFAVDVYGKGIRGSSPEENMKLMKPLKEDRMGSLLTRIKLTLEAARKLSYVDPRKVAAIGFCFGGLCVLDMARNMVDSHLSPLGVASLHGILNKADSDHSQGKIPSKVLVLHGYADPHVPPEEVVTFCKEMTDRGADWQLHAYGHVLHAFTNPNANNEKGGAKYNPDADRRSWESVRYFLHECFS